MVFGGYDASTTFMRDFNSIFFLDNKTGKHTTYHKSVLMPFGEYVPFGDSMPFLKTLVPEIGDFLHGSGPQTFRIANLMIAPAICYEILDAAFVRQATTDTTNVILTITNDSWFGKTEPELHLALAAFRAIENQIPIIRMTNTGISAIIMPDGTFHHATKLNESAILIADLPIMTPLKTPYRMLGAWLLVPLLTLLLGGIALARYSVWENSSHS